MRSQLLRRPRILNTPAIFDIGTTLPPLTERMPLHHSFKADIVEMQQSNIILRRSKNLSFQLPAVTAGSVICLKNSRWIEEIKLAIFSRWSTSAHDFKQRLSTGRKFLGHHLISECGDGRDALLLAVLEKENHILMMQVLVEIGHNNPIGAATAFFPDFILHPSLRFDP